MKKRFLTLLLTAAFLTVLFAAVPAQAADVNDFPVYFSNFNTFAVESGPEYYPDFRVEDNDLLVQSVTTYHWNNGHGLKAGTISIYDWDDNLIGTWSATGRAGSGVSSVYWDIFPNIILKAGMRYYIVDSGTKTWSYNARSDNRGFAEVRGRDAGISVTVNGVLVQWTDAAPFLDANNRTMVPLRAVAEALDLNVTWDAKTREAGFTRGSKGIYFPVNKSVYYTEGGGVGSMDTAAVIVDDRTYAPIRYLAEYFGYSVGWDGDTKTVLITG